MGCGLHMASARRVIFFLGHLPSYLRKSYRNFTKLNFLDRQSELSCRPPHIGMRTTSRLDDVKSTEPSDAETPCPGLMPLCPLMRCHRPFSLKLFPTPPALESMQGQTSRHT